MQRASWCAWLAIFKIWAVCWRGGGCCSCLPVNTEVTTQHETSTPLGGKDKMGERQREWQRWIWSDKAEGTKCCLFKFIILEIFLKCPVLVAHAHCSGRQCGPGVTAGVIKLNRTEILRITRISFTFSLILHMDYFTLMWLHRQRSRTAKCNSSSILIYTEHAAVHQQHPYSFL